MAVILILVGALLTAPIGLKKMAETGQERLNQHYANIIDVEIAEDIYNNQR